MPEVVDIHDARTQFARLVPLAPARKREFGFLAGTVELGDDFEDEAMRPLSAEELADWE